MRSQFTKPQFILAVIAVILMLINLVNKLSAQECSTGTCYRTPVRTVVSEVVVQPTAQVVEFFQDVQPVRSTVATVAQATSTSVKTAAQVAQGTMRHVAGAFAPGARYEGVGFSTRSPEAALRACCYSNRQIVDQSVQYGYNRRLGCWGWFATIQTR